MIKRQAELDGNTPVEVAKANTETQITDTQITDTIPPAGGTQTDTTEDSVSNLVDTDAIGTTDVKGYTAENASAEDAAAIETSLNKFAYNPGPKATGIYGSLTVKGVNKEEATDTIRTLGEKIRNTYQGAYGTDSGTLEFVAVLGSQKDGSKEAVGGKDIKGLKTVGYRFKTTVPIDVIYRKMSKNGLMGTVKHIEAGAEFNLTNQDAAYLLGNPRYDGICVLKTTHIFDGVEKPITKLIGVSGTPSGDGAVNYTPYLKIIYAEGLPAKAYGSIKDGRSEPIDVKKENGRYACLEDYVELFGHMYETVNLNRNSDNEVKKAGENSRMIAAAYNCIVDKITIMASGQ